MLLRLEEMTLVFVAVGKNIKSVVDKQYIMDFGGMLLKSILFFYIIIYIS